MDYQEKEKFSIFCWNIANPSLNRAMKQAEWFSCRFEDIFVLTEIKKSKGCDYLNNYFQSNGYYVLFPKLEGKEYGTMIVSRYYFRESTFSGFIDFLPGRVAGVNITLHGKILEIIGLYVPSRNMSIEKIKRKKYFLRTISRALKIAPKFDYRILCGDFNILEPEHVPHYSFFEEWEYAFYKNLIRNELRDAYRYKFPFSKEYSWVGRTGDGYRYEHCFISKNILPYINNCFYLHEPRKFKLSDHSAVITILDFNETDNKRPSNNNKKLLYV